MGRTLSLLAHLPKLEADEVTHARDCECVRCDAGVRPTEGERVVARRRWEVRQARQEAERALARRRERLRVKQAALELQIEADIRAVDARIQALRAAQTRTAEDPRMAVLKALRAKGVPLTEALARVEAERDTSRETSGPEKALWAQQGSNLRPED
jgi:hypothetical protein